MLLALTMGDMKCRPIDSLAALLEWTVDRWDSQSRVSRVSVPAARHPVRPPYRTLLCHDMAFGYLDDSACDGWRGSVPSPDQYTFLYWNSIDEFVYFSHHFITVPPCNWVETAHAHGVAIYGTLITENEAGYRLCRSLLSDRQVALVAIGRLAELSRHCGVDGWLINIENKVDQCLLSELVWFVGELRRRMREECSWARVIWYDAVSAVDGALVWQNMLNEHNQPLFDVCDGVFLNYCWKEVGLRASAQLAGARSSDVYVGVDVFGRGCPGGGGFNTRTALEAIRMAGGADTPLSAAIFAPGWTVQKQNADLDIVVEHRFWSQLVPYLVPHGPAQWPIVSDFNTGRGQEPVPSYLPLYYKVSRQSLQPSYFHYTDSSCTLIHRGDIGLTGSSALTVTNSSQHERCLPVFKCKLPLQPSMLVTLRSVQKPLNVTSADGDESGCDSLCSLYVSVCDRGDLGSQSTQTGRVIMSPSGSRGHVTDDQVTCHIMTGAVTSLSDRSDWLVLRCSFSSDQVPLWGAYIFEIGVIAPAGVKCLLGEISLTHDTSLNIPEEHSVQ